MLVVRILIRGRSVVLSVVRRGRFGEPSQLVLVAEDPVAEQEGSGEQDRRKGAWCRSLEDALS
jgi:hypothetical protein